MALFHCDLGHLANAPGLNFIPCGGKSTYFPGTWGSRTGKGGLFLWQAILAIPLESCGCQIPCPPYSYSFYKPLACLAAPWLPRPDLQRFREDAGEADCPMATEVIFV